jgi:hypothetical protein
MAELLELMNASRDQGDLGCQLSGTVSLCCCKIMKSGASVANDGDGLFRNIAIFLENNQTQHVALKRNAVSYTSLRNIRDRFCSYVSQFSHLPNFQQVTVKNKMI